MLIEQAITLIIAIGIAFYMYRDAKKRNYDVLGAILLGFSLGIIGLVIWFFIRPKVKGEIKKMNIIAKIILIVVTIVTIVIVLLSLIYQPFVESGSSMLPTFNRGDMLFFTSADDLKVGDIAVYERPGMDYAIIHRIMEITDEGYVFKGDNNPAPDPNIVKKENIKGKVAFNIPLIGYPRLFLYGLGM